MSTASPRSSRSSGRRSPPRGSACRPVGLGVADLTVLRLLRASRSCELGHRRVLLLLLSRSGAIAGAAVTNQATSTTITTASRNSSMSGSARARTLERRRKPKRSVRPVAPPADGGPSIRPAPAPGPAVPGRRPPDVDATRGAGHPAITAPATAISAPIQIQPTSGLTMTRKVAGGGSWDIVIGERQDRDPLRVRRAGSPRAPCCRGRIAGLNSEVEVRLECGRGLPAAVFRPTSLSSGSMKTSPDRPGGRVLSRVVVPRRVERYDVLAVAGDVEPGSERDPLVAGSVVSRDSGPCSRRPCRTARPGAADRSWSESSTRRRSRSASARSQRANDIAAVAAPGVAPQCGGEGARVARR